MGEVMATLGIWAADGSRVENVDMQVDTGASFSQLPDETLRDLGWIPTSTDVPADLADGTHSTVALGEVRIRYNGQDITRLFLFGEDGCPKLLGSDTLQGLRLGVDPVNHRLINVISHR
ncbi:MAG: hypothetical protein OXL37_00235 [Chloroflexota bacterium]|nr:hypothetical protein [Chloroflexota bacterium]MDE2959759.1 hypothetical protein [Chloroflexota bacterium]